MEMPYQTSLLVYADLIRLIDQLRFISTMQKTQTAFPKIILRLGGGDELGLQWINKSRSRYTVYKNNPAQLHHFPGGAVSAFAEAPDGSFWLAAEHGLYHWLPQTDSFAVIKLDKTQSSDVTVADVAIDKDGWVWCGVPENETGVKGLYCYDPANG